MSIVENHIKANSTQTDAMIVGFSTQTAMLKVAPGVYADSRGIPRACFKVADIRHITKINPITGEEIARMVPGDSRMWQLPLATFVEQDRKRLVAKVKDFEDRSEKSKDDLTIRKELAEEIYNLILQGERFNSINEGMVDIMLQEMKDVADGFYVNIPDLRVVTINGLSYTIGENEVTSQTIISTSPNWLSDVARQLNSTAKFRLLESHTQETQAKKQTEEEAKDTLTFNEMVTISDSIALTVTSEAVLYETALVLQNIPPLLLSSASLNSIIIAELLPAA